MVWGCKGHAKPPPYVGVQLINNVQRLANHYRSGSHVALRVSLAAACHAHTRSIPSDRGTVRALASQALALAQVYGHDIKLELVHGNRVRATLADGMIIEL